MPGPGRDDIVPCLSAPTETHHGMGLPATRQRIDEQPLATVSKTEPEHRCITSHTHEGFWSQTHRNQISQTIASTMNFGSLN